MEPLTESFRHRGVSSKEDEMKNKKLTLMAAFVALIMTLAACSAATVKLGEQDNGQSVDVASGDKITITLEGNPTTGYSWEVSAIDPAMVELVGEPDYKSDSKALGSGGVYTFTFKAAGAGTTNIKLVYHRSWEEDVEPAKVFEVTLNVK